MSKKYKIMTVSNVCNYRAVVMERRSDNAEILPGRAY